MKILKGRTLGAAFVRRAILRLATRSVPGAILVGGGLLAKALHDRRKSKKPASSRSSRHRTANRLDLAAPARHQRAWIQL